MNPYFFTDKKGFKYPFFNSVVESSPLSKYQVLINQLSMSVGSASGHMENTYALTTGFKDSSLKLSHQS